MSYDDSELGATTGNAAFLYEMHRGERSWRFTSEPYPVTIDSLQWEPSAVSHSEIRQGSDVAREPITLTFPDSEPFAMDAFNDSGDFVTSVTLYRFDRASLERRVIWKGRSQKAESKQGTIEVGCESIFTSNKRLGLPRAYQAMCPHGIYTPLPGCGLRIEDFRTDASVASVAGTTVTLDATPASDLNGGIFESAAGDLRTILSQNGGVLTLSRAVPGLAPGACRVAPGCNRSPARCAQFANPANASGTNIENFGGQSWIPSKNPFKSGV